jgi:hypothetical protein
MFEEVERRRFYIPLILIPYRILVSGELIEVFSDTIPNFGSSALCVLSHAAFKTF